jgi:hypothetical protein
MWEIAKEILREKYIAINSYNKKEKKSPNK